MIYYKKIQIIFFVLLSGVTASASETIVPLGQFDCRSTISKQRSEGALFSPKFYGSQNPKRFVQDIAMELTAVPGDFMLRVEDGYFTYGLKKLFTINEEDKNKTEMKAHFSIPASSGPLPLQEWLGYRQMNNASVEIAPDSINYKVVLHTYNSEKRVYATALHETKCIPLSGSLDIAGIYKIMFRQNW